MLTLAILFLLFALLTAWLPDDERGWTWVTLGASIALAGAGLIASDCGLVSHYVGAWLRAGELFVPWTAALVCPFLALPSKYLQFPPDFYDLRWPGWLTHWLWGTVQQALMLAFLAEAIGPWWAVAAFVALHAPNPFLMLVTAAGGTMSVLIWQQAPSVLVAGAFHAAASAILDGCLSERVTGAMRIGRGYLEWRRERLRDLRERGR